MALSRRFRGILVLATILLLSATKSFAQSDQAIFTDSLQAGWQDWGWATLNYANSAPVHGGSASVSVTAGAWQAMYVHHDAFDTAPYASLAFWIHGGSSGGQRLQVQALRTGNAQQAYALAPLAANTWQQVTIPLSSLGVAGVADMDGFWIQNATNASAPTFYVDDIRLVGIPPPPSVAVSVDAGQVVGQADPRHFGFNTAIWDAAFNSTTTVARLEDAETKVLRFPGGSLSDEYHWATNTTLNNTWTWATGFDDFASVARSTNATVFITVNYGSGTPQEAAAWVREANVTLGYGFRYWEIGNENYGDWEHDDQAAPHDPYTYANRAVDYIAQMKAVDPTIKIGVVAVTGEDSYANYTNHPATNLRTGQAHNGWTPVMLATLKSRGVTPDFIIHHRYAQAPGAETDAGLLASSTSWAGEVAGLRQMLADYLGAAAPSVEIVCTENNSVYSSPGKQTTSLVNGLFLADSVGQALQTEIRGLVWWALRNSQETGNNNSASLYGWRPYGDYGVLSAESERYPAYYVAKLLKYFARGGEQILRTTSSYALLSAYAARRADGSVALVVINKSPSATLNADVSLSGFVPSSNAAVHSYGIPQDEAARIGSGSPDVAASSFAGASSSFSYPFAPYSVTVLSLAPATPVTATPTPPPTATPTPPPTATPTPPPTATPTRTPTPLPTATPMPIAYTFENGVQGWQASGRPVTKVASTTAKPFAGKRSLAVTLSANGGSGRAYVANPAAPAGANVTFLVWIPANSALVAVQPYVKQGAAGGFAWTGSYVPIASLQPGAWNSFTVSVPTNAAVPLAELGVEFFTKNVKWTATAYVDNVGW